jgi:hypothetical protein
MQVVVYNTDNLVLELKNLVNTLYVSEDISTVFGKEYHVLASQLQTPDFDSRVIELVTKCVVRTTMYNIFSNNVNTYIDMLHNGVNYSVIMHLDATDTECLNMSKDNNWNLIMPTVNMVARYLDTLFSKFKERFMEIVYNLINEVVPQCRYSASNPSFRLELYGSKLSPMVIFNNYASNYV